MLKAEYSVRGPVPQDVIECVEYMLPPLVAGQALVKVLAASINPSDVLTLTGQYGMLPPLPAIGGNEGVGIVQEVAPDVTSLAVGQMVLLPVGSGTWTSHVATAAKRFVPLPSGADPRQLAMLAINPPTASLLLSEFVTLEPGEWVIQNAANSAVGGYLIQLAKTRGLKTVNVVRRESAVASVTALGGDVVLVDGPDLPKRVKAATDGAKIRLAVDAAGGSATERLAQSLAEGGTLVNYGSMSGEACKISAASFVFRDVTLKGFWLVNWMRRASVERQQELYGALTRLIAAGALRASVQATYSLRDIKAAIVAAASGERSGKILLVPED